MAAISPQISNAQPSISPNPSQDSLQERTRQQCLFDWDKAQYQSMEIWRTDGRLIPEPEERYALLGTRIYFIKNENGKCSHDGQTLDGVRPKRFLPLYTTVITHGKGYWKCDYDTERYSLEGDAIIYYHGRCGSALRHVIAIKRDSPRLYSSSSGTPSSIR